MRDTITAGALARLVTTRLDDERMPKLMSFPGFPIISIVAGWKAWLHRLLSNRSAMWEPTQRPVSNFPAAG